MRPTWVHPWEFATCHSTKNRHSRTSRKGDEHEDAGNGDHNRKMTSRLASTTPIILASGYQYPLNHHLVGWTSISQLFWWDQGVRQSIPTSSQKAELVGGFKHDFYFPFHIWDVILPNWRTPSFFRGVGQPPTSLKVAWLDLPISAEMVPT